ncbi:MAG: sigma-54-dependent Fis family transcriptional regulator [Kofleriaceae bacterium]|nr:sigma-54-dependent Fis family transcriptional regulator [Kofleriaceae bacterium]
MAGATDDPRTTEALGNAPPAHALVRECRLTVLDGAAERDGAVHVFASPRTVIGADPGADVVVDDPTMSRFHCEVRVVDGVASVRDLGSRNGTAVDHVPVIEAPLRDGAILTVGRTRLRFDVGARQVEIPLSPRDRFGRLRGGSVAMRAIYSRLEAAAAGTATVLLQGESGTGKDLAAESLHVEGVRKDGPFVVVDCGAIPANLLEAELFGHEAGAFTGATAARPGAFEAAAGGTLLLDEIGELALDLQPKLLRAIERREIQRLGSTERRTVDVRIVAATNRDLRAEVNARRFRTDLYFRLAVLVINLPPLRERTSDIPVLVEAILDDLGDRRSPMARALAGGELLPELLRHGWPGNVRELRNYVEACIVRQERATTSTSSDAPTIDVTQPLRAVRERWVRHVERRYLEELLAAHRGNVSAAARAAGVDRVHLHRLLSRVGLR